MYAQDATKEAPDECGARSQPSSPGQPNEDQINATTVTANAVPAHPKKVSAGLALKRPITESRVTTTIMTAMIGSAFRAEPSPPTL